MRLSIIVPVCNMAEDDRLTFCLDALIHQTLAADDYEIIAVDDASTDDSYQILTDYAARYPGRIKVIKSPENHRQGGAKNLGLGIAKGAWIGFVDADDWVTPDCYERLLKAAEDAGADMAGCDYSLVDTHTFTPGQVIAQNDPQTTGPLDDEKRRGLILEAGSLVVKIYQRHIVYGEKEGKAHPRVFPEDIFYEDNAVSIEWMMRAKHFCYLPEPLYYYYQHASSTVHTVALSRLRDRMTAGRLLLEKAKASGAYDAYPDEVTYQFTRLFYINTLFGAMQAHPAEKGTYALTKALGQEMRETFPAFRENRYYRDKVHPEEQTLIAMQQRSQLYFYLYYRLLWWYRRHVKKV